MPNCTCAIVDRHLTLCDHSLRVSTELAGGQGSSLTLFLSAYPARETCVLAGSRIHTSVESPGQEAQKHRVAFHPSSSTPGSKVS